MDIHTAEKVGVLLSAFLLTLKATRDAMEEHHLQWVQEEIDIYTDRETVQADYAACGVWQVFQTKIGRRYGIPEESVKVVWCGRATPLMRPVHALAKGTRKESIAAVMDLLPYATLRAFASESLLNATGCPRRVEVAASAARGDAVPSRYQTHGGETVLSLIHI